MVLQLLPCHMGMCRALFSAEQLVPGTHLYGLVVSGHCRFCFFTPFWALLASVLIFQFRLNLRSSLEIFQFLITRVNWKNFRFVLGGIFLTWIIALLFPSKFKKNLAQETSKSLSCDYLLFIIINKIEKIADSLFPAALLKEHHNLLKNIKITEI